MCYYIVFCKQKTAYEMRISDWSSDVCSSDLQVITYPGAISRTLPLCIVADNYPALAMQVDQFLKRREVPDVLPALFTDIFALDAMAEMLDRPLYRSEEHTSELQSLMRISYAVFYLKKKKTSQTCVSYLQLSTKHHYRYT